MSGGLAGAIGALLVASCGKTEFWPVDVGATGECPSEQACVDVVPDGWLGPFAAAAIEPDESSAICKGDYDIDAIVVYGSVIAPPAECSCSCGSPTFQDAYCDLAHLDLFEDPSCAGSAAMSIEIYPNGPSSCSGKALLTKNYRSVRLASAGIGGELGAGCEASVSSYAPEVSGSEALTACSPAVEAWPCAAGKLCLEPPAADFDLGLCIYRTGDVSCPRSYPERVLRFGGVDDDRACSPCSCTPPLLANCNPTIDLSVSDPTCTNSVQFSALGQCAPLEIAATSPEVLYRYNGLVQGGACAPSGAEPIGGARLTDPVTFCCVNP